MPSRIPSENSARRPPAGAVPAVPGPRRYGTPVREAERKTSKLIIVRRPTSPRIPSRTQRWGLPLGLFAVGAVALTACSASVPSAPGTLSGTGTAVPSAFATAQGCGGPPALRTLWQERVAQGAAQYQPLGPGDVLVVSVVGIPELRDQEVQVTDSGSITLPFAGTIAVGGMSLDGVEHELERRFAEYIRSPEVHVVMRQNRSQTVAVMGLVSKPTLVPLTSPDETIMDAIGEAGGLTSGAAQRILFIPGGTYQRLPSKSKPAGGLGACTGPKATANKNAEQCARDLPAGHDMPSAAQAARGGPAAEPANATNGPIVVDLYKGADQGCLNLPVRAGDTIVVPPAGNVMVGGWVARPGEVQITRGMTVLGAVTAAGGALFSSNAEVLRANTHGRRTAIPVDLSAVRSGKEPDVPVEAGDVVVVQSSTLGAIPYALHELFNRFGAGMAIPIP